MSEIICIGTNHMAEDGDKKLLEILESENPDIIAVEGTDILYFKKYKTKSEKLEEDIKFYLKENKKEYLIDKIKESIGTYGYEHPTSKKYACKNKKPFWYIDDRKVYNKIIKSVLNVNIKKDNKKIVDAIESFSSYEDDRNKLLDAIKFNYQTDKINFRLSLQFDYLYKTELLGRDDKMAENVLKLVRIYPDKKIAVVAGCLHMVTIDNEKTLYSKLKKHNELSLKRIGCF